MLGWLPNASADAIARREVADLNATRTGSADREGAWNWQDTFGAWLAGSDKESILALAKKKADKQLEESLSGRIADVEANLGTLKGKYSGVDRKTKKQVLSALAQDEARIKALAQARTTKGFNVADLDPSSSAIDILAARSKQVNANDDAVTNKLDDRHDASILRDERIRSEGRLDRNLQRQLSAENNKMQLQLEYARLAQADKFRVQDRKDQAIMALMSGLSNLGAGFAL